MKLRNFRDGLASLTNLLANRRNAHSNNRITATAIDYQELRAIYRTGIGSKIIRLKAGHALKDTLQFSSSQDQIFYDARLAQHVKNAVKFMLAFGRSLIVIHEPGADLSKPLPNIQDWGLVRYHVFSGDMVNVGGVNLDLNSPDYLRPVVYNVRGFPIHPSRVVDFSYVQPVELDAPEYQYGGISEFELIRNELVNDAVVQRVTPAILEKNSTLFYKIMGFKDLLADNKEQDLVNYFTALEDMRSVYGAGIIDAEDMIEVHDQALTNLSDADMITLRRLAMVTGIPISYLVGENVKGLNSSGENERQVFQDMIEQLQSDYLLDKINRLMKLHGRGTVWFKENQGETALVRIEYEAKALANALLLWQMGEDYGKYLEDRAVIEPDKFDKIFGSDDEVEA